MSSTTNVVAGVKYPIPVGWMWKNLGSVGAFSKGAGITKGELVPDGIPCVRYGELYTRFHNHIETFHSFIGPASVNQSVPLLHGDILFAESGETKEEIGKAATLMTSGEVCAGGDIIILRPSGGDDPRFLGYALNSEVAVRQKSSAGKGDAVVHIGVTDLAQVVIPFPPYVEQVAIAGALWDADRLIESLDALIAKKRNIKHATLDQLISGRQRLPGFLEPWEKIRLGARGQTYGGLVGKTASDFGVGNSRYVPFLNVLQNAMLDHDWTEPVEVSSAERQNTLRSGDILFNGSSETPEEVGLGSVVPKELEGTYLNSFCIGYRPNEDSEILSEFLAFLTRSMIGRRIMQPLAQGSTRYNLSKTALLSVSISLPSLNEQREIVQILTDMDAEIDALVARRDKMWMIRQGMMQGLLSGKVRLS